MLFIVKFGGEKKVTYNQLFISLFKFSDILGLHFSFIVLLFVSASGRSISLVRVLLHLAEILDM